MERRRVEFGAVGAVDIDVALPQRLFDRRDVALLCPSHKLPSGAIQRSRRSRFDVGAHLNSLFARRMSRRGRRACRSPTHRVRHGLLTGSGARWLAAAATAALLLAACGWREGARTLEEEARAHGVEHRDHIGTQRGRKRWLVERVAICVVLQPVVLAEA